MAQERVDNLFASESWTAVYTAFTNVSLKAYDFDTIRDALLTYIAETYPQKFNDFIASSEFIAILDLIAYLGHSLSFRNDMNTRENFMDTAERRESVLRMAKTLGYNKTRPVNARGFMKVTSVKTDEPIYDSNGDALSNRTIIWNDTNNIDWYENFVTILNNAFTAESSVENPSNSMTNLGIENYLHQVNEDPSSKSVKYNFSANVAGSSRSFEVVRSEFTDNSVVEAQPIISSNMTFVQRNDGQGPASDRSGFFVLAKSGNMKSRDFSYETKLSNRIERIADANISNSDVWVQKISSSGDYLSDVQKVDNDTRETAIYHTLKNRNADIVRIGTLEENAIELSFSDGVFGNAAYGSYRVWYRVTDNENYNVEAGDIKNTSITIPYLGSDGRTYRLTVAMKSTIDFTENFEGENYLSVKRVAPRSYYAQDRMVNAQDYNVLPLSLGSNIVKKVKAVNTTYAGQSRYFEMDDVLGHHSNVHVNGADGSVYIDDDIVKVRLPFNKANSNIDHFLKYELSSILKHPSLINTYYQSALGDPKYDIRDIALEWTRNPTAILQGTVAESESLIILEGDHLLIADQNSENAKWYVVQEVLSTGNIKLDTSAPSGIILQIVNAPRTKFEDSEIAVLKNYVISENYTKPFYLWYDTYNWTVWYEGIEDVLGVTTLDEDFADAAMKIKIEYKQGLRVADSEFVATIEGNKVVFDSAGDVKFHYSNHSSSVIDQKTKLEKKDKLFINYYNDIAEIDAIRVQSTDTEMVIGQTELLGIDYDETTNTVSFNADFSNTGAPINNSFVSLHPEFNAVTYDYRLVDNNNVSISIPAPTSPTGTIIGTAPAYTVTYTDLEDASSYIFDTDLLEDSATTADSDASEVSDNYLTVTGVEGDDPSSSGNIINSTITVSSEDFINDGFPSQPSMSYFTSAVSDGRFFFVNESEMGPGITYENITSTDVASLSNFVIEYDQALEIFTFTLPTGSIETDEPDVRWKAIAASEYTFTATGIADINDIKVSIDGFFVDESEYSIVDLGNDTYRAVFWKSYDTGTVVSIQHVTGIGSFDDYELRVLAIFEVLTQIQVRSQKYSVAETHIDDAYLTTEGYVDYNKVKLSTVTNDGNPFGMVEVITDSNVDNNPEIVLETYVGDGEINYERVSKNAVATATDNELIDFPNIWFDQTNETWNKLVDGEWVQTLPLMLNGDIRHVSIDSVEYRVVPGRSYVEDTYMNFRWDHYADENTRIDPSTSNIIDLYVLTGDYVNNVNKWINGGFSGSMPTPPNNYELSNLLSDVVNKASISDHLSFIPAKFKLLFGEHAAPQNQSTFKVVKRAGTNFTDSEIKSKVSEKINTYFDVDNWDFGERFYFSELAAYLHNELGDMISSVVMAPKYSGSDFKKLLSISSEPNEILLGITTSKDIKIIASISDSELAGE